MKKYLIEITFAVLVLQLASCGTLFYPERRGQEHGRIDPSVAILDGLGLLLFIIPGVIAFAVDFSTGAIYLPPEQISMVTGDEPNGAAKPENKVVYLNPEHLSLSGIEDTVAKETLLAIDLNTPAMTRWRQYISSNSRFFRLRLGLHKISLQRRSGRNMRENRL